MHASGRSKWRGCVDFLVKFIIITLTKGVLKVLGNLTVSLAISVTVLFECNAAIGYTSFIKYMYNVAKMLSKEKVRLYYLHRQSPDLFAR